MIVCLFSSSPAPLIRNVVVLECVRVTILVTVYYILGVEYKHTRLCSVVLYNNFTKISEVDEYLIEGLEYAQVMCTVGPSLCQCYVGDLGVNVDVWLTIAALPTWCVQVSNVNLFQVWTRPSVTYPQYKHALEHVMQYEQYLIPFLAHTVWYGSDMLNVNVHMDQYK